MLQQSKGFIINASFIKLSTDKKVGSFFYCQLKARWIQGIRNFGLWQIDVVNLHIFTCVMLNYRGG